MWIFSYLSNGMNIADIAQIENKQITKDGFEFVRKKTKETAKSNLKSINVAMQPRMMEIIERWGNPPEKKYLFPILDEEMDEETMDLKVRNLNNLITKKIKDIAEECEIDKKVTAVYARHSFATVLRNSGASIEYISEALGHNNVSTTMHYLAKFDSGVVKKWSAELL
jgi:site-specific recombinase XerD